MKIEKTNLGLAGEYAVASELCRRNIYAQLTLGHQKRVDLLVYKDKEIRKIEVKCKQGNAWPNCKGIYEEDTFLVFVDYARKKQNERPDFYVLTVNDWREVVKKAVSDYKAKHPDRRVEIENNCPILLDEINRYGNPYKGHSTSVKDINEHKDAWDKIVKAL